MLRVLSSRSGLWLCGLLIVSVGINLLQERRIRACQLAGGPFGGAIEGARISDPEATGVDGTPVRLTLSGERDPSFTSSAPTASGVGGLSFEGPVVHAQACHCGETPVYDSRAPVCEGMYWVEETEPSDDPHLGIVTS